MQRWIFCILTWVTACSEPSKGDSERDSVDDTATVDTLGSSTGCYDVPMTSEVGTGDISFLPIEDGDVVQWTHGTQGPLAFHLWTAINVEHTHEQLRVIPAVTMVESGQVISGAQGDHDQNSAYVQLLANGECSGAIWGVHAFLNDFTPVEGDGGPVTTADICGLEGKDVRIDMNVTDLVDGRTSTSSATVTLTSDPLDLVDSDGDGYLLCDGDCNGDDDKLFPGSGCPL